MKSILQPLGILATVVFLLSSTLTTANSQQSESKTSTPSEAGKERLDVARAKKQAKMLDTLYKTAIVLITENYVDGKESMAAGDAFQALFKAMKDNEFHEVRLLDATGDAYDPDNDPKTDFEKEAVKAILAGKPIYERVVKEGDKEFLLSATPIPVVMEKCTMCHSSYENAKGPIGALGLKIPLE
ncbi:MAG: DUF3365 domain-containing protein [Planctomycetales bacterium]|nr:DUF3365 domain-containing protein [Planctomycetales bacterium]